MVGGPPLSLLVPSHVTSLPNPPTLSPLLPSWLNMHTPVHTMNPQIHVLPPPCSPFTMFTLSASCASPSTTTPRTRSQTRNQIARRMASFPNQNNSTRKVTTTTKTTFTDQKSTCDPRSATFVSLDVSSSMRGAPVEEAIGSLDNLTNMMCKTNKNAHMEVSVFGGAHAPGGMVVMKRRPGFAINFDILKNNIFLTAIC